MTDELSWPAPAKLNLMLHITARRADGYHELQSVFQFIDYCDELSFSVRADNRVARLSGNEAVAEKDDLVVKAALALQKHTACQQGVDIRIHKQLPMGAGLGGGSSDAATTLHALNQLWQLALSDQELADIGLKLGADVPVFVHGFAAFAEGIGEQLTPVTLDNPWYLVITPHVHVSTVEIFRDNELTRDSPAIKICDLSGTAWTNVCTPVVVKRYPEVAKALKILAEHAEARMSGTGASVFAAFDSKEQAENAMATLKKVAAEKRWRVFIARGLNQSPLMKRLKRTSSA